jgi:DNA-binding response OmpR family regulator
MTAKVIVVDDDPSATMLIRVLLELDGFEVVTSFDHSSAVEAASPEIATFIIDFNLGQGGNGLDLIRAIRQGETAAPSTVPTILVSGDERVEQEALAAGADIFLVKPYSPSLLGDTVRRLMADGL